MTSLGKHMQALRKKKQLSQIQLEQRTGIKREYISRLERGKLKNPTLNTMRKIAQGLEVPLENLLLCSPLSQYFQDFLQQADRLKQRIAFLKKDLHELNQTLNLMEEKIFPFLVPTNS